ncbi:MAG TPA: hypothetical protein GX523_16000 [Desulfitobacterium dehalogenans]|uniref:Uncharacterized protein n=1 Tax=Desulfitobacterium dehalogenans TaxID=36854 RepID=A0A7C7DBK0_9FIRM|nr:hypothetical protein [Desulfitobacterium dehalogenans]
MKKSEFSFITVLALSLMLLSLPILKAPDYINEIKPYLGIMHKLNLEYGLEGDSKIRLVQGEEQNFYSHVKNMSLNDYEQSLRDAYEQALRIPTVIKSDPNSSIEYGNYLSDNYSYDNEIKEGKRIAAKKISHDLLNFSAYPK